MRIFNIKRCFKRGSLSLSINAIVMLVLAIMMLGLGIAFMKGMLGKGSSKVAGAIDAADLEMPATADKPLSVQREISMKASDGESFNLKIGIYNTKSSPITYKLDISCKNQAGNESSSFLLSSADIDVPSLEQRATGALLSISGAGVKSGATYICKLTAVDKAETPQDTLSTSIFIKATG